MSNLIASLRKVMLSFDVNPVFTNVTLSIYRGDKICVVGRNGGGKSSLLKTIANIYQIDDGEIWLMPNIKIGYLSQDMSFEQDSLVSDFVYTLNLLTIPSKKKYKQSFLSSLNETDQSIEADMTIYDTSNVIQSLGLDKLMSLKLTELSGGMLRKVLIAKTLLQNPDILLLDEPTNHLDIETIEFLEHYLKNYQGAVICISHDRAFLNSISNKTFWLRNGICMTNNKGYINFEYWSESVMEEERVSLIRLEKKLEEEEKWKSCGGISGRRKRNQHRLANLMKLRVQKANSKALLGKSLNKIELDTIESQIHSKIVVEFKNVNKKYNDKVILTDLTTRIIAGDKIGIIGYNGTGKTTFLRLITDEIKPDSGVIKTGKTISITYYDQKRTNIDYSKTLWETLCPGGGEYINLGNRSMHVVGYLKKFLFQPSQAKEMVSTLSGGQVNRLLLAKALASPGSLLILDEPTNDLDIETLDMISDILSNYTGTLILVSHNRDFINDIATKLLCFTGNGNVEECFDDYTLDLLKTMSNSNGAIKTIDNIQKNIKTDICNSDGRNGDNNNNYNSDDIIEYNNTTDTKYTKKIKPNFAVQREITLLPNKINKLELQIKSLELYLLVENAYKKSPKEFIEKSQELEKCRMELENSFSRFIELEQIYGKHY